MLYDPVNSWLTAKHMVPSLSPALNLKLCVLAGIFPYDWVTFKNFTEGGGRGGQTLKYSQRPQAQIYFI